MKTANTRRLRETFKPLRLLGFLALALLPAALLFNLGANFYYDWHNHQWLIGYFGEYFRQHWRMPESIALFDAVGVPLPVFYGFTLYPVLGALSALFGAGLALRIAIAVTFAVQFAAAHWAARATLGSRPLSLLIAVSTTWSTYSLTNLYNRSALPEFFAATFLTTAVCFGALAVAQRTVRLRTAFVWLAGGFATLTVGTHPPTALIASAFIVLLAGTLVGCSVAAGQWRWASVRVWLFVGVAGAVIMAPWIYANVQLHSGLSVVGKYHTFSFSPDGCDSLFARFAPFPYDPATVAHGKTGPGTPYIEAPITFGFLVVLGWNLLLYFRIPKMERPPSSETTAAKWLAWAGVAWFALTVTLSLSPGFASAFRFLAPYVQFGTRFVSHANVGLLVAVLATGFVIARREGYARFRLEANALTFVVLAIAAVGLLMKLSHAAVVMEQGSEPQYAWRGQRAQLVNPGRPAVAGDYAMLRWLPQLRLAVVSTATQARFGVGDRGSDFGLVGKSTMILEQSNWVITNAVAFPWSRVTVNGREIAANQIAAHEYRIAVKLPPGEHRFEWEWRPDVIWSALRLGSQGALVLLLGGMAWALGRVCWNPPENSSCPGE